jgi:outer membrane protein OmpA-like peptidoglycan-associated protein
MKNLTFSVLTFFVLALTFSCQETKEKKTNTTVDVTNADKGTETANSNATSNKDNEESSAEKVGDSSLTAQYFYTTTGNKAAIQIRVGDVDNLGFGWDKGFDPFCGQNTRRHRFPWPVDKKDHLGTDRIMVVSSYQSGKKDGYTSTTSKPNNTPVPIKMDYKKPTVTINEVVLQLMLDDFQAPVWKTSFQFNINDKRLTYIEPILNNLNQTGPVGKLVQVGILPEDLYLFKEGAINIMIDDPVTGAGDGFAIDFVQVLINPKEEYNCTGSIKGVVKDEQNKLLKDVLVSANGLKENLTKEDGTFNLEGVPVGMINVSAGKKGYETENVNFELKRDETKQLTIILKKKEAESENYLDEEIKEKGFVNLYGILFDTGKDVPKQESNETLEQLGNFIKNNPNLKLEIIGHTDSEGDDAYNKDLSQRRAKGVLNWLQEKKINVLNIQTQGMGESSPVASNKTESGKALNRRVEIKVVE